MSTRLNADSIVSPLADSKKHGSDYFRHLRTRLRWQFLITYLTPLLLLSAFFYFQYTSTYQQSIKSHLTSVAENKRNTVSLFLQERVANIRSAFQFKDLSQSPSKNEMAKTLDELRKESTAFVDLGLFDPEGSLVAYSGPFPSLLGRYYNKEEWYQALHKSSENYYVSNVFLGFRHKPHFIIATRREIGGKEWTLRASVDPEWFSKFVGKSILLKGGEAFITNRSGEIQTTRSNNNSTRLVSPLPKPDIETQVVEMEDSGKRFLTAFAWLVETEWALVVQVPRSVAYAPMNQAHLILVIFFVLTLVLLILLVARSTQRIVGQLESADQTKEDLRQQLFNAAKLASVGEMAAGVAHEINNPLAIIYEEAGLLKDTIDPQFNQKFDMQALDESLDAIMQATLRGRAITSNLLAFARKHDADPELIDVNDFVEKILAIKSNEFTTSNIKICRNLQDGLPKVLANRNQMEQVMLNLLNNASDAIKSAGWIGVKTRLTGENIQIDVEDSGCGMTSEQLQKVFFPFYTTKGVGKGTGLGLSISYGIIKAIGGQLEVNSQLNVGSTFTIFLPVPKELNEQMIQQQGREPML
ncbi:MAG: ATP-binding protein [Pseudomonadota bacterium]